MERTDIVKLVRILSANYRKWPEDGKEEDTVLLWEMMLGDMDVQVAKNAVKYHLSKSVFPPTVADIREAAAKVTQGRILDAIEAWDFISRAIRKYGYYRQEEAMASLSPDVADMVRRFTWAELCHSENIDTLRAQFRMAWETQSKRKKEQNILPTELVELMESSNLIKRLQ